MASIQQFFVTLNAATPDLFARFHKRTDRHLLRQAINPSAAMLRSGLIKLANHLNQRKKVYGDSPEIKEVVCLYFWNKHNLYHHPNNNKILKWLNAKNWSNSRALAMQLHQSWTKPLTLYLFNSDGHLNNPHLHRSDLFFQDVAVLTGWFLIGQSFFSISNPIPLIS